MRIQDALKFSLELILPERLASAMRRAPVGGPSNQAAAGQVDQTGRPSRARAIIEDLDHGEFGGPSFGPHTMHLMTAVLEDIEVEMSERLSDDLLRQIASAILKAAADGERDAGRLKAKARAIFAAPDPAPENE